VGLGTAYLMTILLSERLAASTKPSLLYADTTPV
jgi:hypothetical protein